MGNKGERFKQLRIALGKSQEELAKELGVSQGAISKWEMGQRKIPDSILEYLAKHYRVNLNWLIIGEGSMFVKPDSKEIPPERAGIDKELAIMISMLSPEQQEGLKALFRGYLRKPSSTLSSSSSGKREENVNSCDSHDENVVE